jgi:hypothetical protein
MLSCVVSSIDADNNDDDSNSNNNKLAMVIVVASLPMMDKVYQPSKDLIIHHPACTLSPLSPLPPIVVVRARIEQVDSMHHSSAQVLTIALCLQRAVDATPTDDM